MRFMLLVKGDPKPGQMPSEKILEAMGKFNEELAKAGVLLDLSGLHPSANGARVRFSGGKRTVIDGPFAESKELVGGYWIIQAKSMDEAIEWAKRAPMDASDEFEGEPVIEVRQIFELDEFGESPAIDKARKLEKELEKKKA
ncbi:MAG: YciI family protein [Actinobacteria bacterium]|nr:MAG: YciI family protein [Actinomycetota bacterium]